MLPLAPGANGQPPIPPSELSMVVMPSASARDDVRQAQAARIVQMHAIEFVGADLIAHEPDQPAQLFRIGVTGRVRKTQFVAAGLDEPVASSSDLGFRHPAFERATECRGKAAFETSGADRRAACRAMP